MHSSSNRTQVNVYAIRAIQEVSNAGFGSSAKNSVRYLESTISSTLHTFVPSSVKVSMKTDSILNGPFAESERFKIWIAHLCDSKS